MSILLPRPFFAPEAGAAGTVSRETSKAPVAPAVSRETSGPTPPERIIAVINQKGGVGKTTTAVNFAADLATRGYRTLLIDLDPQGNAATSLGIDRYGEGVATSHDLLFAKNTQPTPLKHESTGLLLLPGTVELIRADLELLKLGDRRDFALRTALAPLLPHYDFIVIDSPPSLGILTLNILIASGSVIIPIQCEYLALEGLSMLLDTLGEITTTHNPTLQVLGCLVTMADLRTNLSQQVVADVRTHLGDRVFTTMIPRTVRLSECPSHGKTIFQYDRWGPGARSYEGLTNEVLERLKLSRRKN